MGSSTINTAGGPRPRAEYLRRVAAPRFNSMVDLSRAWASSARRFIVLQLFSHPPTPLQWRTVLGPTCFLDQSIQGTGAHGRACCCTRRGKASRAVDAQRHVQWLSGMTTCPQLRNAD